MSFPPGSVLRSVRDPRKWGVHEHYFGERTRSTVSMADPNQLPPVYKSTRAKRPGGGGAKLGGAICRIKTFARAFDLLRPYNTSQSASGVGTGFVLDAVQIPGGGLAVVTAYHVVDHAVRILVSIDEHSAEPVLSELVLYDHILDIAVLRVPIAPPPSIVPLAAGDSDVVAPNHQVQALGYALGADILQFTVGYISGRTPESLQLDAAINGGNSGGPLTNMQTGEVIGIVTSGYNSSDAQNVNYATPIVEALQSIRHLMGVLEAGGAAPASRPQLSLNASFDACSTSVVEALGAPRGAYCRHVHMRSELHAAGMREGDVLCRIGLGADRGYDVDLQGRIQPDWWTADALPLKSVLYRANPDDMVHVAFWSVRRRALVDARVAVKPNLSTFRLLDLEKGEAPYSVRGGLVVQPMHAHILKHHSGFQKRFGMLFERPHRKVDSLLVVTYVCPETPFTKMDTVGIGDIVTHVNGAPTMTLSAYEEAWRHAVDGVDADACVVLGFYDARIAAATVAEVRIADAALAKEMDKGTSAKK